MQLRLTRAQRTTVVTGVLCFVLILVVLQLWLVAATMNAYLGGDDAVVWSALGASVACLALNLGCCGTCCDDDATRAAAGRPRRDDPAYFALVMATGIVSLASELLGLHDASFLASISDVFVYIALVAWAIASVGLARHLITSRKRPAALP